MSQLFQDCLFEDRAASCTTIDTNRKAHQQRRMASINDSMNRCAAPTNAVTMIFMCCKLGKTDAVFVYG